MRWTRVLAVWGAVLGALVGGAAPVAAASVPEADPAYHGFAVMDRGRVDVRLTPRNHGPGDVSDATVRLRRPAPLADRPPALPDGCARTGAREVVCRTGGVGRGRDGGSDRAGGVAAGPAGGGHAGGRDGVGGGAVDRIGPMTGSRCWCWTPGIRYFF